MKKERLALAVALVLVGVALLAIAAVVGYAGSSPPAAVVALAGAGGAVALFGALGFDIDDGDDR